MFDFAKVHCHNELYFWHSTNRDPKYKSYIKPNKRRTTNSRFINLKILKSKVSLDT